MDIPEINFSYKRNKYIFKNLEIKSFSDYNITAFCGHNGVGKTTLLKILAGIYPYDNKTKKIHYDSKWFIGSNRSGLINNLSLNDHLNLLIDLIKADKSIIDFLIDKFELREFLDNAVFELSDGQFIKGALLLAIICSPKNLFLDEVFSSLDYVSQTVVIDELIKLKNTTNIVFVSHNLDIISQIAKRIIILKNGQIEFDSIFDDGFEEISANKLKEIYLERA